LIPVIALIAVSAISIPFLMRKPLQQPPQGSVVEAKELTLSQLVERVNGFTLSLYGLLLRNHTSENFVVSPFNVYVALTMLYEGSNSSTREELGKVMGLDNGDACSAYRELISMLPIGRNNTAALYVANGVWLRKGFPFRDEYVSRVKQCFNGYVEYFTSIDELVESVNRWVEEKTNGLIKNPLNRYQVSDDTVAVLVSAIYFKADWLKEFTPIGKIGFWNGSEWIYVDGMHVEGDHLRVVNTSEYIAVEIPYKDTSLSMVIIMPRDFKEAVDSVGELVTKALENIDNASPIPRAHLVMPKFNVSFNKVLSDVLREIRVHEVFQPGVADLTRMADIARGSIWVDKVIHKAVIKMNEKGTEAAAATAIIIYTSAPVYSVEVVVDKPFIYILRDRDSKAILFIGHVVDPSKPDQSL
jgi:serine protease inhibitor